MATLGNIKLKGYRSIKEMNLALEPLNVLIGANGAGKSNFVSFFKMLNEMMAGRLQQYVATSGRARSLLYLCPKVTPQLEATLEFTTEEGINTYYMRLAPGAYDSLLFADETLDYQMFDVTGPHRLSMHLGVGNQETGISDMATQGIETALIFRHILNGCRVYHFHDTSSSARIRQNGYIGENRWLLPDGGNLAALLFAYRQQHESVYRRIVSTLRKMIPEFDDFDLAPDRLNPKDIALNWRKVGTDYLFGPHQISDGSIRAIAIVTLFLQPEDDRPDVIILDEPELGLHPYALELLAGLARAASVTSQVIVATQSQTFLENFEPGEIIVVDSSAGSSKFTRLDESELKNWLDDYTIGQLWEKNVLGGGPVS